MKKMIALVASFIVLAWAVEPLLAAGDAPKCSTKYPIILVHGAFFKDENMLGINYWWQIPSALEDEGAVVYVCQQDTFNGSIERAKEVAAEIGQLFALNPTWKKVNIIAHSQGPLDSRYMISNLGIPGKGLAKNYVASLTSISGVHRGSEVADLLWKMYKGIPVLGPALGDAIMAAIDAFADIFYYNEQDQNTMLLLYSLTSDYMKNVFNPMTPDAAGVYYQSWGGKITGLHPELENVLVAPLWAIMKLMGAGDNDGLVSLTSAKWGKWRGALTGAWWGDGVNHFNEINHFFGSTSGFDAPGFYIDVVKELKSMGY
ncbi:MAG TPA: alpha/beta hydrolase [Spirochaetota bacterium]|nr:alpha/beta hydrolase [Spirochaetota bacterium]HOD13913.1 alpha/beta hydrolase [Spirochaetota bacterium]HPG49709.1 alpha/beta hydrolase [Spirochaetota bacterium]HPN12407.1 alpha/beta hydrolase [Spirochaetota bacterium]HQL80703.1 alpha/beta hydrolase [Spirochaetota bacterium]